MIKTKVKTPLMNLEYIFQRGFGLVKNGKKQQSLASLIYLQMLN